MISDDDIPSDIDMNDPYFAEEFKDVKKTSKKKKGKKHEEDSENEEDQNKKVRIQRRKYHPSYIYISFSQCY